MAITQAMLDAERERLTCDVHMGCEDRGCKALRAKRAGWDACLAFLREHGVTVPAQRLADSAVIVEMPAEVNVNHSGREPRVDREDRYSGQSMKGGEPECRHRHHHVSCTKSLGHDGDHECFSEAHGSLGRWSRDTPDERLVSTPDTPSDDATLSAAEKWIADCYKSHTRDMLQLVVAIARRLQGENALLRTPVPYCIVCGVQAVPHDKNCGYGDDEARDLLADELHALEAEVRELRATIARVRAWANDKVNGYICHPMQSGVEPCEYHSGYIDALEAVAAVTETCLGDPCESTAPGLGHVYACPLYRKSSASDAAPKETPDAE